MATITFPTQQYDDVTLDVDAIVDLRAAGMFTQVTVAGGFFYSSPAPYEMFEVTLAAGGGVVPFDRIGLMRAGPPP